MDRVSDAIGIVGLVAAAVFLYVGARLAQRPVSARAKLPALQFVIWWAALGVSAALGGTETILWGVGALSLPLALTFETLNVLAICGALWGLVGYLTYLYRGRYRLAEWTAFYTLLFVFVTYLLFALKPVGLTARAGTPSLVYGNYGVASTPVLVVFVLALLAPEAAGIVLYASLLRRTSDRTLRFRIIFVTASLAIFFGADLISIPASVLPPVLWSLTQSAIEAGASLLSLLAYFPPKRLREALRVTPVPTSPAEADA